MNTQGANLAANAMLTPARASAIWLGRVSSGVVILLMLLDGAVKLVPWPMVTETMDRMGYGSSENLARFLGVISLMGMALNAFPPTSFVGAILTTGYLGSILVSHVKIESPLLTDILLGFYFGVMLWGALWLRGRRQLSPITV
ncbi:DoxX family protein [Bradyrhizobium sp.]|uniref:DoxX family protein n=1 Tax=Bradyrhizobium sp. TaxID=376 RepID=UPI00262A6DB5|nr:DoxX family protein [Bradyrhizobium sp.]